MLATVHYDLGQYSGKISVNVSPDDDDEFVIAKAKRALAQRHGPMPSGLYSSRWRVTEREG